MHISRSEGPDFPKVFAFSTFFYPKLIDGGHASVKRWSKKVTQRHFVLLQLSLKIGRLQDTIPPQVDLFSCSLVFVPVHLGMHW